MTRDLSATKSLRAFIYLRNSKGKRGTSTRDQEVEDRRLCDRNGWPVVDVFQDKGISASRHSKKDRPDYDEMIKRMRAGECDILVYWEASRAYRDMRTYLDLRDLCEQTRVLLCYYGRVYDMTDTQDRYTTGQDALKAENGADEIRERNLRTHRLAAERGAPVGIAPYGYRREYDPATGDLLRQVEDELRGPVVRRIFTHLYAAKSVRSLRMALNGEDVPAPGVAEEWRDEHIRAIARNPAYVGKRIHHGVIAADGQWDGLVKEEIFYAVQPTTTRIPGRRENAVRYLQSGIALCGKCEPHVSRLESKRVQNVLKYSCPRCAGVTISMAPFDDVVQAALLRYVERPAFVESLKPQAAGDEHVQVKLRELDMLEAQLADARALASTVVDGRLGLSAVSLAALEGQLAPMIAQVRSELEVMAQPLDLQGVVGPGAGERWAQLDLLQKRALIRSLRMKITVYPAGRGKRTITPDRYDIQFVR